MYSQETNPVRFGKIAAEDFQQKIYSIDSSAHAVVIAEIGSSALVGNNKSWFSLEYKVFKRIHILNKAAFDLASVTIPLYQQDGNKEKVQGLKATTYNLENGAVTATKLNTKDGVFEEKVSTNRINQKFTLPNVKEGSIIEYEYKMISDFLFNFQPWVFQGMYPCLWSEYNVSLPYFYDYVTIRHGHRQFDIETEKQRNETFTVRENSNTSSSQISQFTSSVSDKKWVVKNTTAIKEENYISALSNLITKVEFQLAQTRAPLLPKKIMGNWESTATYLLAHESFGAELSKKKSWLEEAEKKAVGTASTDLERAKNIFVWVRDNFKCTRRSGIFTTQSFRETLKNQHGTVAEINLLLTSLLQQADLKADPVLLSTRSNGYTYELYPIVNYFNYVISTVQIDGKTYYLDASVPFLGFNKLHYDIYNGHARVINKTIPAIYFNTDSLVVNSFTKVSLTNGSKGQIKGTVETTPGYFESIQLRESFGTGREAALQENFKSKLGEEYKVEKLKIEDFEQFEKPIRISCDVQFEHGQPDIIYFSPILASTYKSNPFTSAVRLYPVEMPYRPNETYLFSLDVPEGYAIEELPASLRVKLNEQSEGLFDYRCSAQNGKIQIMYRISFSRANFDQSEYEDLRAFYSQVVKKHSEQIVFKKI